MAQVKIFGLVNSLNPMKKKLSDAIHSCIVEALDFPPEKRFHPFSPCNGKISFALKIVAKATLLLKSA